VSWTDGADKLVEDTKTILQTLGINNITDAYIKEAVVQLLEKGINSTATFSVERLICRCISSNKYATYENMVVGMLSSQLNIGNLNYILGMVFLAIFGAFAVFAVLWLVLAVFALVHIFCKNKAFLMWYVKALCWIPSLIWLVLLILPHVLPLVLSAAYASIATSVVACFATTTWVSCLCYVILWLLSIVFSFTVKRKIRKLQK
jgi:hypothetical protein